MKLKKECILILILVLFILTACNKIDLTTDEEVVRIGYFHSHRTIMLYRAYINDVFLKEDITVKLLTKTLGDDEYRIVPKDYQDIRYEKNFGEEPTGNDLIEELMKDNFDGATVGWASFLMAANKGLPVVAVAELGHDTKDKPAHAIIFRSNVSINKSSDIKGKTLASRRSSGGDRIILREFLYSEGLDPDIDVKIIDDLPEDKVKKMLRNGSIDGASFPLGLRRLVTQDEAYIYRKMDWMNPEISQGLLLFKKDFVEKYPERIEKVVRAYMKRIIFEQNLPPEARLKDKASNEQRGLTMETDFHGLNHPQYDLPPIIDSNLLDQSQKLLLKYEMIDKIIRLEDFIDNSFVERIHKELEE